MGQRRHESFGIFALNALEGPQGLRSVDTLLHCYVFERQDVHECCYSYIG